LKATREGREHLAQLLDTRFGVIIVDFQ